MLCAVGGLWLARAVHAQDAKPVPPAKPPTTPDLDFLEYLGTWQENDEEWLVSEQWQKDRAGAERIARPMQRTDSGGRPVSLERANLLIATLNTQMNRQQALQDREQRRRR